MLKMVMRKISHQLVAADKDVVVAAIPLPQGGILTRIDIIQKVIASPGSLLAINKCVMYGMDGYVVPVIDPDTATTYDTAYDRLVPKANKGEDIDLDTTTVDAKPTFEPGSVQVNQLFQMTGLAPRRIFKRRKLLSFADIGPVVGGGTAVDDWTPAEAWKSTVNARVRVDKPSFVIFAFSNPALDNTQAGAWVPPVGEAEWGILQYLEKFLEDAFVRVLGLVETGAESPYEEAEAYIERLLADKLFEKTADAFHPQSFDVFTQATFQISVPGRLNMGNRVIKSDT